MDWTNKNVHPSKIVNLGDEVDVMILDIDEERRRISLGIKQCQQNPWDAFGSEHAKGDKISGTIKSITDFGIFIGLTGNIDGLVHLSDISWTEAGEEAVRSYNKGDEIEYKLLNEYTNSSVNFITNLIFEKQVGKNSSGSTEFSLSNYVFFKQQIFNEVKLGLIGFSEFCKISSAIISPLARVSIACIWPIKISSKSVELLRVFASKFIPPDFRPPSLKIMSIICTAS